MTINSDNKTEKEKKELIQPCRPILISGTQRSGTSMIAGCLFYAGVFMGNWFLKRDKHNPTGYFEDIEFGELDENRWKGAITEEEWEKGVRDLIKSRQQEIFGFSKWGWKNPSSGLYIKDYQRICNPLIIWCKRGKEDTLESMNKMHWKEDSALRTYNDKMEFMNQLCPGEYLEVWFEDVIENPGLEIGRILGYIGINPPKSKLKKVFNHIITKPNLEKLEQESYMNYL